jgi:hypothetical protein
MQKRGYLRFVDERKRGGAAGQVGDRVQAGSGRQGQGWLEPSNLHDDFLYALNMCLYAIPESVLGTDIYSSLF